jgi:hypothetical protein
MRVFWTKDLLPGLCAMLHQHQGISMPALTFPNEREVCHARQRKGMVDPELGLASLHHLYK